MIIVYASVLFLGRDWYFCLLLPLLAKLLAGNTVFGMSYTVSLYWYWLAATFGLRATLCWSRLTVNICFVISRNKCNKFVSSSMMQQHDTSNTAVGPKNLSKCMVSRSLHHVPQEHDAALTKPGNIVYFCKSRNARWTNRDCIIQIWYNNDIWSLQTTNTKAEQAIHIKTLTRSSVNCAKMSHISVISTAKSRLISVIFEHRQSIGY